MSEKSRKKHYKYTSLDADELRKRREDQSIFLRKQKRDEQVRFIRQIILLKIHLFIFF
jgi:hypothetical protein